MQGITNSNGKEVGIEKTLWEKMSNRTKPRDWFTFALPLFVHKIVWEPFLASSLAFGCRPIFSYQTRDLFVFSLLTAPEKLAQSLLLFVKVCKARLLIEEYYHHHQMLYSHDCLVMPWNQSSFTVMREKSSPVIPYPLEK